MECPHVPTMFHLGRAIKTVNLLRNLDKFGRPIGVAVSDDAPGTSAMIDAVDAIPGKTLVDILAADADIEQKDMFSKTRPERVNVQELSRYPLPTNQVPLQFTCNAWKHWYTFLEQHLWHKPTAPKAKKTVEKALPEATPTREAFLSTMRGALTQAVQYFPSVLSGTLPFTQTAEGHLTSTSWLRIGQGYFDAGALNDEALQDIMAIGSDVKHFDHIGRPGERRSRQYCADEFRWIHFSPEDPRLLYMNVPPPLALIHQQLEKHLLLTPHFSLVPHQLELYAEGVETLPRSEPLDPNYLGTVIIALPTMNCKGGSIRLTNFNHVDHQGAEIEEMDLSKVDSDLSRVIADIYSDELKSVASKPPSPQDLDLERLESDLAPDATRATTEVSQEKPAPTPLQESTRRARGFQNWSSFSWVPYGGNMTGEYAAPQSIVKTGRSDLSLPAMEGECEPNGMSWLAFTKNIPYSIEKVESGARIYIVYHIISKSSTKMEMVQPTMEDIQVSTRTTPHMESVLNIPLINALFPPHMRQAGISKLVSMAAYYFNHAHKSHWLAHGDDDLTTLGIALRDTYAPELIESENLMGADAWLYNIFKWACEQPGIFRHPVRVLLAPVAMIHQNQLKQPQVQAQDVSSHKSQPDRATSGPEKEEKARSGNKSRPRAQEDKEFTGPHRWETVEHHPPSNLVYFLDLEGWEHAGPSLSHDAYSECSRFSTLPARTLSDLERNLYGSSLLPSNTRTQWNSVPLLFGQRWGEELDSWEPAPVPQPPPTTAKGTDFDTFHVVGRKTFATTALILQKIPPSHTDEPAPTLEVPL